MVTNSQCCSDAQEHSGERFKKAVLDMAPAYQMQDSNFFTVLPGSTVTVKVVSALSLETQF